MGYVCMWTAQVKKNHSLKLFSYARLPFPNNSSIVRNKTHTPYPLFPPTHRRLSALEDDRQAKSQPVQSKVHEHKEKDMSAEQSGEDVPVENIAYTMQNCSTSL